MRSFISGVVQYMFMQPHHPLKLPKSGYYKFLIERLSPILDANDLKLLTVNTKLQDTLTNRRLLGKQVNSFNDFLMFTDGKGVVLSAMEVSKVGLLHLHIILIHSPIAKPMRAFWKRSKLLQSNHFRHFHLADVRSIKATLQYLSKQMYDFRYFTVL